MNEGQPFTPPPARPPKKHVRWWLIASIFGAPVLLIVLATLLFRVGYTLRENSGRQAMSVEIEKLVSEGQAIDRESIDELYRSRTSQEYAKAWFELLQRIASPDFSDAAAG